MNIRMKKLARRNNPAITPAARQPAQLELFRLVSDDASYVTGVTLPIDGGMLAQLRSPQVDQPLPASVAARLKK